MVGDGSAAATALRARGLSFGYLGLDRSAAAVARAREREPGLAFREGDVTAPPAAGEAGSADAVLCLEVLEHLTDPRTAVARLAEWTRDAAVVSVPHEPWFRLGNLARGKYLATGGNHPEHVQAFSPASLHALLATRFAEVRVERCFPWLVGVARRPRRSDGQCSILERRSRLPS